MKGGFGFSCVACAALCVAQACTPTLPVTRTLVHATAATSDPGSLGVPEDEKPCRAAISVVVIDSKGAPVVGARVTSTLRTVNTMSEEPSAGSVYEWSTFSTTDDSGRTHICSPEDLESAKDFRGLGDTLVVRDRERIVVETSPPITLNPPFQREIRLIVSAGGSRPKENKRP